MNPLFIETFGPLSASGLDWVQDMGRNDWECCRKSLAESWESTSSDLFAPLCAQESGGLPGRALAVERENTAQSQGGFCCLLQVWPGDHHSLSPSMKSPQPGRLLAPSDDTMEPVTH